MMAEQSSNPATATFGGGCFWCTEAIFKELAGVERVVSGYAGGTTSNPTYRDVCSGTTGHAEAVQITFDPAVVRYEDLLEIFFATHDPTTVNRQGNDVGTQYRSAIFYHDGQQRETAERVVRRLEEAAAFDSPIVTEISPFSNFFPAEESHQDFFELNPNQPYCQMVVGPKLAKFRQAFSDRLTSKP